MTYRNEPFETDPLYNVSRQSVKKVGLGVDHPTVTIKQKSDAYEPIFTTIKDVLNAKNSQYSEDPINVLSTDDLLCQIKIKATRAQLANFEDKRIDELTDIIVYSILTLKKIYDEA